MKNLPVLLFVVLFLAACGNETEATEETANELAAVEEVEMTEVEETESAIDPIVDETSEEVTEEETEIESEEVAIEQEEEIEEIVEEPEEFEEEEAAISERETITADEIQVLVHDFIGYDDEVVAFEVNGGDIYLALVMAADDLFTPVDLAVNRYSQVSDELLYYEGWNNLTIEFIGIGTITMNSAEAEMNEYGYYFPTMAIEENLY